MKLKFFFGVKIVEVLEDKITKSLSVFVVVWGCRIFGRPKIFDIMEKSQVMLQGKMNKNSAWQSESCSEH